MLIEPTDHAVMAWVITFQHGSRRHCRGFRFGAGPNPAAGFALRRHMTCMTEVDQHAGGGSRHGMAAAMTTIPEHFASLAESLCLTPAHVARRAQALQRAGLPASSWLTRDWLAEQEAKGGN